MSVVTLKDCVVESWYRVREFFAKAWLFIKRRPVLTCPVCKGEGGRMSGYEEREWSECSACWHHWEELADHGMRWPEGRLPVWMWVRAKVSTKYGTGRCERVRDIIKCRAGWHDWQNEDSLEPGLRICACCYESKSVEPMEDTHAK